MEPDGRPRWRRWLWRAPLSWLGLTVVMALLFAWLPGSGGVVARLQRPETWWPAALLALLVVVAVWFREWLRGLSLGSGRNPQLAVVSLLLGAGVVAAVWLGWDHLNVWGGLAAVVWLVAAVAGVVVALSPGRDGRRLLPSLYLAGLAVLAGWSLVQPADLAAVSRRLPDQTAVCTAGAVLGVVVVIGVLALVRQWRRGGPGRHRREPRR